MKGRVRTLAVVLAVVGISAAAVLGATATTNRSASKQTAAAAHGKPPGPTNCGLRHNVKHVIYLIFDNVHFLRDNPNVPSDLEQMPHLLEFHPRERHAADQRPHGSDLAYGERDPHQPDRHVLRPARPGGGELVPLLQERRLGHDALVELVQVLDRSDGRRQHARRSTRTTTWSTADSGTHKNAPAPWVPYTRAGCDWGATALANVVLENTGTGPAGDMTKVFGSGSPEWNEAVASNGGTGRHPGAEPRADRLRRPRDPLRADQDEHLRTATRTRRPTSSPTSRAATPATRGSSGRSTSTRRSARPTRRTART